MYRVKSFLLLAFVFVLIITGCARPPEPSGVGEIEITPKYPMFNENVWVTYWPSESDLKKVTLIRETYFPDSSVIDSIPMSKFKQFYAKKFTVPESACGFKFRIYTEPLNHFSLSFGNITGTYVIDEDSNSVFGSYSNIGGTLEQNEGLNWELSIDPKRYKNYTKLILNFIMKRVKGRSDSLNAILAKIEAKDSLDPSVLVLKAYRQIYEEDAVGAFKYTLEVGKSGVKLDYCQTRLFHILLQPLVFGEPELVSDSIILVARDFFLENPGSELFSSYPFAASFDSLYTVKQRMEIYNYRVSNNLYVQTTYAAEAFKRMGDTTFADEIRRKDIERFKSMKSVDAACFARYEGMSYMIWLMDDKDYAAAESLALQIKEYVNVLPRSTSSDLQKYFGQLALIKKDSIVSLIHFFNAGRKGSKEALNMFAEVTEKLGKSPEKLWDSLQTQLTTAKDKASDFKLIEASSCDTMMLSDFFGKVLVLNFWTGGCKPCIMEMPILSNVLDMSDTSEIEFLSITIWDDYKKLLEFAEKMKFNWPQYYSKEGFKVFGIFAIPRTVIIDKKGIIRFDETGGLINPQELLDKIEAAKLDNPFRENKIDSTEEVSAIPKDEYIKIGDVEDGFIDVYNRSSATIKVISRGRCIRIFNNAKQSIKIVFDSGTVMGEITPFDEYKNMCLKSPDVYYRLIDI